MLLGLSKLSLENIAIVVQDFSETLRAGVLPGSLKPSPIGEYDCSETALFTLNVVSFVDDPTEIVINSISILFTLLPVAIVSVAIRILHVALAVLQIVFPVSLVNVPISVAVFPMAMLSVLN